MCPPMRKVIAIACFLLLAGAAAAQDEGIADFEELDLEVLLDVVYSAAKHKQDITESPSAITVLTREDIETSGARTIPELLRMVPGMDVGVVNPLGYEIGMRGETSMNADTVLLLVDGRDLTMELFGFPSWVAQHFSMDDIERIEVIRGPGSALYGANAFSGVTNVILRAPGKGPRAMASVRGGEHGRTELSCRVSENIGSLALAAGAGLVQQGFWTGRGDLGNDMARGWLDARIALGENSYLDLDGGFFTTSGQFVTFVTTADVDDMLEFFTRARAKVGDLSVQAFYDRFYVEGDYHLTMYYKPLDIVVATLPPIDGSVDKVGVQAQHSVEAFHNRLTYGAEYYYHRYSSEVFLDPEQHEHRYGFFAQDEVNLRAILKDLMDVDPLPLILTAGVRFDESTFTKWEISPRAALIWKPAESHGVRFGYAHAFMRPTFFESSMAVHLDSDFGFDYLDTSNRDLVNKTIDSLEAGYTGSFLEGKLQVRFDLAYNWYKKIIHFQFDPESFKQFGPLQIPDINGPGVGVYNSNDGMHGHNVELHLIGRPADWLRVYFMAGYRQLFYDKNGKIKRSEPIWRLSAGADLKGRPGWTASLRAFFVNEYIKGIYNPEGLLEPRIYSTHPATWFLNARFSWPVLKKPVSISAGIEAFNLLDFRFRESGGTEIPNQVDFGAERLSRRIVLFVHGEI
ncbi:TonB-dependent receptor plug domain-containing protein [Myxococcota bacterium]